MRFTLKPLVYSIFILSTLGTNALNMLTPSYAANIGSVDFSELVETVGPGVVRVTVTKKPSIQEQQMAEQIPEALRQFFGDQFQMPPQSPQNRTAYGSAFFISPEGYLLTNHHVVSDAKKVTITLNDRREVDAEVIGSDPRTDVAVLKVNPNGYPVLKLAQAQNIKVGEPVLAIGSPFGFDYSASAGIVSAKARALNRESAVPFIQSDVALNPGSSGGPLFNKLGEVIGINSRIFSGTGGYMGLSFSIPIDVAMDVYDQIRSNGKVTRTYLGVFPQDIDRDLAEVYQLPKPEGALVTKVEEGTAASKGGIKEGDIILTFNNQPITQATDLINLISRSKPGQTVPVTVKRDGKMQSLQVVLQAAPVDLTAIQKSGTKPLANNSPILGLQVRTVSDVERQQGLPAGIIIQAISYEGMAAQAGLEVGDIITKLNNQATPSVAQFVTVAKALPNHKVVAVNITRKGVPMIIGLRLK